MCLAGTVVACWFVTQEVAGLNTHFFAKLFFKFYFFCRFYRIHLAKTLMSCISRDESNLCFLTAKVDKQYAV